MKITLESTTSTVYLGDVQARVWEGWTEGGVPVVAFIPRVSVKKDEDRSQFEAELVACGQMRAASEVWPMRMVL